MHQIELKRVNAHLVDIQIKSDYCSVLSNAGVFLQTVYKLLQQRRCGRVCGFEVGLWFELIVRLKRAAPKP